MKTDIFIKTCKKDKDFLHYCLKSIAKYAKNYNEIVIVSDEDFKFDNHNLNIRFIVEKVRNLNPKDYPSVGYVNQMLTKLKCVSYSNVDRVFILDSDMILIDEFDLSKVENEWFYRKWKDAGTGDIWKSGIDTFYNLDSKVEYMSSPGWVITRHLMNCFLSHICQKFNTQDVEIALLKLANVDRFSEFQFLGAYIDLVYHCDYKMKKSSESNYPIRQFWSWHQNSVEAYIDEINKYL